MGKITLTITYPADAHTPAAEARDRIEAAAIAEARRCAAPPTCSRCRATPADAAETWPDGDGGVLCQMCWEEDCALAWWLSPHWAARDRSNANARHGGLLRRQTVRRGARRIWVDNARRIQVRMTRDRRAEYLLYEDYDASPQQIQEKSCREQTRDILALWRNGRIVEQDVRNANANANARHGAALRRQAKRRWHRRMMRDYAWRGRITPTRDDLPYRFRRFKQEKSPFEQVRDLLALWGNARIEASTKETNP